ncbi:Protein of unknown function [Gryllus bimaculatus]|nr:Protein of unknown function [Gryllus bimaculatus]
MEQNCPVTSTVSNPVESPKPPPSSCGSASSPKVDRESPEPNCAICLGKTENKSFTDSCLHQFCFNCLLKWSKVKAECPLCKQSFKSIIHNVRSNEEYEEYHVEVGREPPQYWQEVESNVVHFRYSTTLTPERQRERFLNSIVGVGPFFFGHDAIPNQRVNRRTNNRRRYAGTGDFRAAVYRDNLWVNQLPDVTGRYRDCTPEFYREIQIKENIEMASNKYTRASCSKQVRENSGSLSCNNCKNWFHKKCSNLSNEQLKKVLAEIKKNRVIEGKHNICRIINNDIEQIFVKKDVNFKIIFMSNLDISIMKNLIKSGFRIQNCISRIAFNPLTVQKGIFLLNPAQAHRLVPWLNRELNVLRVPSSHLMMVVDLILNLLTQHPINSVEFESRLSPHIGANTHHFLHEFYAFARSPYDMVGFDQSADYQHRPSFATEVQAIDSDSSDSDMIVLSPSVNNPVTLFPPRPPTPGPNAAEPFPVIQGLNDIQPLNLSASSSRPPQRLSPIAGPSSVVDEDFILMITRELQNPTYSHLDRVNTVRSYPPLPGSSREIPCQTVDSDSDDCVIVGYVKPRHERTPEIITLNSDVETADEVERGSESVDDSLKYLLSSSSSSSSLSKTSDTSDSEYVPHPSTHKKVTPKRKKPRKPHSSSDEGDSAEVRRRRIPSSDSDSESESAKHRRNKSKGKRKRIVSPRESSDDSKIDRIRSKNRKSRKEVWRIVRKQEPETDHDYSLDCYDPPYTEDEWASLSSDRPKLRSIVITKSAGSSGQREASYSSVASSSRSSSHYHDCKHHRHKSHKRDIRKRKDKRRSESSSPVRLTKGKKSKRKRSYRNDDSSS